MLNKTEFSAEKFSNILLPVALASVLGDENITFIVLLLSYLCNVYYFKERYGDVERYFLKGFFIFIAIISLIVLLNGFLIGSDFESVFVDRHRLFLLILFLPVIVDFSYVTIMKSKLDYYKVFYIYHVSLFLIISAKLVYVLLTKEAPFRTGLEGVLGQSSGFFGRNPSFYDDYAVAAICASIWTTMLAVWNSSNSRLNPHWLIVVIMMPILWGIIIYGESRGGWLGITAALGFSLAVLVCFRRYAVALAAIVIVLLLSASQWDRIVPEATKSWPTVKRHITSLLQEPNQSRQANRPAAQVDNSAKPDDAAGEPDNTLDGGPDCSDGKATAADVTWKGRDANVELRFAIYDFAFRAWLERPLLGYGAYDKHQLVKRIPTDDMCAVLYLDHAHNLYLHIAVIGGLVLLIPVLIILAAPLLLMFHAMWCGKQGAILYAPSAAFSVFIMVENLFNLNFANLQYSVFASWTLMTTATYVLVHKSRLQV